MAPSDSCRICLEGSSEHRDLIQPCQCRGSMALVHRSCLNTWRMTSIKSDAFLFCDICHTPYSFVYRTYTPQQLQTISLTLLPISMFAIVMISGYIMKVVDICISRDLARWSNFMSITHIHMLYGVLLPSAFGLGPFCSLVNIGMPHIISFYLHELSIDSVLQVSIEIAVFAFGVVIGFIRTSNMVYELLSRLLESSCLEPLTISDRKQQSAHSRTGSIPSSTY